MVKEDTLDTWRVFEDTDVATNLAAPDELHRYEARAVTKAGNIAAYLTAAEEIHLSELRAAGEALDVTCHARLPEIQHSQMRTRSTPALRPAARPVFTTSLDPASAFFGPGAGVGVVTTSSYPITDIAIDASAVEVQHLQKRESSSAEASPDITDHERHSRAVLLVR